MCGIVGYIGSKEAQNLLLEGLSKLEYRGYDSAGLAVYNGETIGVQKNEGRLTNLEEKLRAKSLPGTLGIGHTRWATHGKPSDQNSHPHTDQTGRFAVVHNGIIENYIELKEELIAKGFTFESETDSEVVAKLLADMWNGDLVSTVRDVVARLEGAYALGIISELEPDKLVAVRQASPLIVGVGESENFIASDIPAILQHTRDVYILEDGEMAVLKENQVTLMKVDGTPVEREVMNVKWDIETAEKGGYDHFMLKEIHEQPKAIRDTLSGRLKDGEVDLSNEVKLTKEQIQEIEKIHFVACGTAYHAGLVGKYVLEDLARIPVEVDVASEYRYRNPLITEKTLVVVISQSGETADTLAALREAKKHGARVLAITNVVGSSVSREADDVIITWAGPEIAVASTKAYTSQLIAIYMLGVYLAQVRGGKSREELAEIIRHLEELPEKAEQILGQTKVVEQFARDIASHEHLFFLGRGLDYAVALEGSLKLKEISYIHSEAYAAGELKHGTLALIEENIPVIALATQSSVYEKMISNIQEVKARGAYVLGFAGEGDTEMIKSVDEVIHIPSTLDLLAPVLTVIPLQLFAYYACLERGFDVDKPRNLAKSVTVE
ncbi:MULTISPECIES: glutamine--fructose-6-phosphate transaminase (isomerizing) [Thermoactinomyces]|jgi:glutamine---fructose-6-phosphate transaminase (isomerizing)|uniref:Glutamine--fructose-6-phosphate aminotransferase [isomerizing] n=1 Tax=Thermoactinomyces vulgaris TaxID=2026 RepID=A0ABS0QLC2_THEVU|nr:MULTISPECIES: glutamine--fructose-6-phosphate transaminase (isomerizing) [Thermoactinomyces]KFZ39699.1 glutamine--fructose-6-phosphate aminotransferase [Thermoactinomyces sp. Gus2-1]KYQ85746.1 glutamine--fructose-6-phosphate aminotransferase [Thermoactinomyces sp. AS95]MBA4552650.1 glutamine--fructose-6-phosphate transaminase (isomerizing) [Thermoactinomyces vulgaris]MBA4597593.1 glutamine--fructose-6-phosphate transaminase (isomerizing) [Thermoactinomyces vulgaris]MBH8584430.1 glutamine--f